MLRPEYFEAAVADETLTGTYVKALDQSPLKPASGCMAMLGYNERYRFTCGFNDFCAPVVFRPSAAPFIVGGCTAGRRMVARNKWALAKLLVEHMHLVLPGTIRFIAFPLRHPLMAYTPAGLVRRLSPVSA